MGYIILPSVHSGSQRIFRGGSRTSEGGGEVFWVTGPPLNPPLQVSASTPASFCIGGRGRVCVWVGGGGGGGSTKIRRYPANDRQNSGHFWSASDAQVNSLSLRHVIYCILVNICYEIKVIIANYHWLRKTTRNQEIFHEIRRLRRFVKNCQKSGSLLEKSGDLVPLATASLKIGIH